MKAADAAWSASLAMHVGPENIRALILEKEKELQDINECRTRTLKTLLRDKEATASAAKETLRKLQHEFEYHWKLLEQRNEELARNKANCASLENVLRDQEAELNEIRVREIKLQTELQSAKEERDELEIQYQQKLKDAQAQAEGARWAFDEELKGQQDAMETQRRQLENQSKDTEKEVESQRRELTVMFDDVMRQRETEFKRESEELQTKVRELELTNQELVKKHTHAQQRARVEELKTKNEDLKQAMPEKDKEIKSLKSTVADVKVAKVVNGAELLEGEVAKLFQVKQQLMDEYESKMAELLQLLHSVEKAFVQQKTQHHEELRCLSERKKSDMQKARIKSKAKLKALAIRLREREERVEALQAELKYAKWDTDDKFMDAEREIKRVRSVLQKLEDEQHCVANKMQQRLRVGDREAQSLQERLQESARQIALLKEKVKEQRQELLECIETQEDLQRELVAVNLRWENLWQEQQQELDERHELHLRVLEQEKNCLVNEKLAVEERLLHAENEVQRLRSELSSQNASTGITDSFGSQYLASAANLATKKTFESAPPLWSDDSSTLSPVPGVLPLVPECPLLRSETTLGTSANANALETENAKLRELIRQMKESLTQQAEEMETLPGSQRHQTCCAAAGSAGTLSSIRNQKKSTLALAAYRSAA